MAAPASPGISLRAQLARRVRDGAPTCLALGATALPLVSNGVAGIYAARRLGPAQYGHVAYALAAFGLVTLLGSLGLATRAVTAAAGRSDSGGESVALLALARLVTLLPIALGGLVALALAHDAAVGVACAAGALALARGFLAAAVAGSGRVATAAVVESLQGFLYLAALLALRVASPGGVYAALVLSHAAPVPLVVAIAARKGLLPASSLRERDWKGHACRLVGALGGVYALTVMVAMQGPWLAFVFGRSGRVAETAYLNVCLSLAGLAASVCLAVHANLYFPRLCRLLAARGQAAAASYARSWCWRFLAAGLAAAAALTLAPGAVVGALYSPSYQAAAGLLGVVAWAGALAFLEQVLAWNLLALGDVRGPLVPVAAKSAILGAGGLAAVAWCGSPLRALLAVYVAAALAGWLLMLRAVRRRWPTSAPLGALHAVAAPALACTLGLFGVPVPAACAAACLPALAHPMLSTRRDGGDAETSGLHQHERSDPAEPRVPQGQPGSGRWGRAGGAGFVPRGGPRGEPVGGHLHPRAGAPQFLREAAILVDRVHGDGLLPDTPMSAVPTRDLGARRGEYAPGRPGAKGQRIVVARSDAEPHLTTLHEIGHFLDHHALGRGRGYASEGPDHRELDPWRRAIEATPTVRRLREAARTGLLTVEVNGKPARRSVSKGLARRLLAPSELFARSYAQYIAQHHPDHAVYQELRRDLAASNTFNNPVSEHWDVVEFEPVARAFDDLITRKPWVHAPEAD